MSDSKIKSVEELEVFKKSHSLTLGIYKATSQLPKEETYGLVSQMRRASASINSNLIEGCYRATTGEFKQFVGISRGSAAELVYQLSLCRDLELINIKDIELLERQALDVMRMLNGLFKSLQKK